KEGEAVERGHHPPPAARPALCSEITQGAWPGPKGFVEYLTPDEVAAMSRSLKKGPYVDQRLLAKVERQQRTGSREPLKTWARDCTVVPELNAQPILDH